MTQITIIKIIGYGPWTLTLGSDREHELQMIQASIYQKIQRLFSERGSLVFLNRADEFFVVSDGLDLGGHVSIQRELEREFDLRLSMSIGRAANPFEANLRAYEGRRDGVILNKEYNIYGILEEVREKNVTLMHLDVEDLTSEDSRKSPYEISGMIFGIYSKMADFFLKRNSLAFFMGGDNFMVVADETARDSARAFINAAKLDGITFNCGIGTGLTGREAARLATGSLDMIRKIRDSGGPKPEVYEMGCS